MERLRVPVRETDAPDQSIVAVTRPQVDPIQRLLATTFDAQSVDIREADVPDAEDDTVLLDRDGELIASSSLQSVNDARLLVDRDRYRTGQVVSRSHSPRR